MMKERKLVLLAVVVMVGIVLGGCGPGYDPAPDARSLDASMVPNHLRPALPMATRFGIADGGLRGDALDQATPEEIQELTGVVRRYGEEIDRWLDSLDESKDMSDEAAALMFMLLAFEEIGL